MKQFELTNKALIKSLIIVPSITGCISTFASVTLIVSIFRSNQKLATVYRRLIVSLSVFDIIASIPQVLSSLPMPAGTIWGAIGNDTTCDLQGFLSIIGLNGALLYSLSLAVYFLLVVKFEMPESKIKKCAEPFLHAIPIVYSLAAGSYIYANNNYGPSGTVCVVSPEPLNCEDNPEVECPSNRNTNMMFWIGGGLSTCLGFIGNVAILVVIWWAYRTQVRKNQGYGHSFAQSRSQLQSDEENQTEDLVRKCCSFCPIKKCLLTSCNSSNSQNNTPRSTSVLVEYLSRPSRASVRRLEEMTKRAAAYVIAFLFTYTFTTIYRALITNNYSDIPFIIILLSRFFYPLQGMFNVLVYTYPHTVSYRRNHTEYNWFQAFWKVVTAGGDSDQPRIGALRPRRRSSIHQMQRVLEQSEYRNRRRSEVEGIRTSGE